MQTSDSLKGVFWEDRFFEGLFENLFRIYKMLWFVIVLLWVVQAVMIYRLDGWQTMLFLILLQAIFFCPLAALGHASNKYALGKGFWGRVVRLVCYLYGVFGYASIVGFPISLIASVA